MASKLMSNERLMQAVEDRMNGNRPLTSKAYLQCRIAEIHGERMKEHEEFEVWQRRALRIKQ